MDFVGLISGGKDSIYSIVELVRLGHRLVCVANLHPPSAATEELDSMMLQTVGWSHVPSIARALGVPLLSRATSGCASRTGLRYGMRAPAGEDEVEDLAALLRDVLAAFPSVRGVSSGAIASDYQRHRVESISARLGLLALAPLWARAPRALLDDMVDSGVVARIIKVAAGPALPPHATLGRTIGELLPRLDVAAARWGVHVAGEGGEYETLVFDAPVFPHFSLSPPTSEPFGVSVDGGVIVSELNRSDNARLEWRTALVIVKKGEHEKLRAEAALRADWRSAVAAFDAGDAVPLPPASASSPPPPPARPPQIGGSSATSSSSLPADDAQDNLPNSPVPFFSPNSRVPLSSAQNAPTAGVNALVHARSDHMVFVFESKGDDARAVEGGGRTADCDSLDAARDAMRGILADLAECLAAVGSVIADVFFVRLGVRDMREFSALNEVYGAAWDPDVAVPARVTVQSGRDGVGAPSAARVSGEFFVARGSARAFTRGMSHVRSAVHVASLSKWAPLSVGPYAQCVTVEGALAWGAGQIGLVPETMQLVGGGLRAQLEQALRNAARVLTAAGAALTNTLAMRIFLAEDALVDGGGEGDGDVAQLVIELVAPFFDGSYGRQVVNDDGSEEEDWGGDADAAAPRDGTLADPLDERMFSLDAGAHTAPAYLRPSKRTTNAVAAATLPSPLPPCAVFCVGALPRGAAVEVEFIALTTRAATQLGGVRSAAAAVLPPLAATSRTSLVSAHYVPRACVSAWATADDAGADSLHGAVRALVCDAGCAAADMRWLMRGAGSLTVFYDPTADVSRGELHARVVDALRSVFPGFSAAAELGRTPAVALVQLARPRTRGAPPVAMHFFAYDAQRIGGFMWHTTSTAASLQHASCGPNAGVHKS